MCGILQIRFRSELGSLKFIRSHGYTMPAVFVPSSASPHLESMLKFNGTVLASAPGTQGGMDDPHGQHLVPMNWWESAASI